MMSFFILNCSFSVFHCDFVENHEQNQRKIVNGKLKIENAYDFEKTVNIK